jgi:hypothetical protein
MSSFSGSESANVQIQVQGHWKNAMAALTCQEVGQEMFVAFYSNLKVGTFPFPLPIEGAQG